MVGERQRRGGGEKGSSNLWKKHAERRLLASVK